MLKSATIFFIVLAILNGLLSSLIFRELTFYAIFDGLIFIVFGILLYFTKSRTVAVLSVIFTSGVLLVTMLTKIGIMDGGTNIFLSSLLVWMSIRAGDAAFFIQKHVKTSKASRKVV